MAPKKNPAINNKQTTIKIPLITPPPKHLTPQNILIMQKNKTKPLNNPRYIKIILR